MLYRALVNIDHDQIRTPAGEFLELNDKDAEPLLECKAIEPGQRRFGREIVVPGTSSEPTTNR